jgi:omega-6 fatty acid desaturase (delta-12 desaturase)
VQGPGAGWTRQPAETKPAFSVGTLRKAIPEHCWKRSLWRSSAYLGADLAMLAALVYASSFIDAAPLPAAARWLLLWPLYWFFAGAVATGVWVSGGSCGQLSQRAWLPASSSSPPPPVRRPRPPNPVELISIQ